MLSVNRIAEYLAIDKAQAKQVRAVLELNLRKGERVGGFEDTAPDYEIWHDSPSRKLYILNRILDGFHGVESIRSRDDRFDTFLGIAYLNTGDSYAGTIMYDYGRRKWILSSWGDVVERQGKRFSEVV